MFTKEKTFFTESKLSEYYNDRASKYKNSIKALQWQSEFNQYRRFEVIYENLLPENKSLCDLGCGYGDFFHYLKTLNTTITYTGIDISANMIVGAQRAYPKGIFKCTDIKTISMHYRFDVVIACGVFNLRMENHNDYLFSQLQRMAITAKKQIIFNVLSDKANSFKRSREFVYFKKKEMIKLLDKLNLSYKIIENYLPNDMTISITL